MLRELGAAHGIAAETVAPVLLNGEAVSSSRIREALKAGDPGTATRLLTRPFAIEGVVVHGDKRGRELGWPTANVELGTYQRPAYGIYAVRVRLDDGSEHDGGRQPRRAADVRSAQGIARDGACSTGTAICTGGRSRWRCTIIIRPEMKFDGMDALKAQMDGCRRARRLSALPAMLLARRE